MKVQDQIIKIKCERRTIMMRRKDEKEIILIIFFCEQKMCFCVCENFITQLH